MKKQIIIDCKNLNDKGIHQIETVVRKALEESELEVYVKVRVE